MPQANALISPLLLTPQYREYVWGGHRLRPDLAVVTAEAWIVYEDNLISGGPLGGLRVKEAAAQYGRALLGARAVQRTGSRFPLLIKLIDTAAWLSLQVHPNDEQAARLEGAGFFGKTEAWYFIEAEANAEILCGMKAGVSTSDMTNAIRRGAILDLLQRHAISAGDSVLIPPGTIHAIGPGLLVYEVQQTSDITYRVFDWNRPASAGRPLHIEKSIAVTNPAQTIQISHLKRDHLEEIQPLVSCAYFTLRLAHISKDGLSLDTQGETFHALTCIAGRANLSGTGWNHTLGIYETILIPAAGGRYEIRPIEQASILIGNP